MLDREHERILRATVAAGPTGCSDVATQRRLAVLDNPDWLVYRSVREGMAGLLYVYLRQNGLLDLLSDRLGQRLAQTYYHSVQNHVMLETELLPILKKANAGKIPVVFLQGFALQNDIYTDPGQRPMYDIDLWVLPAHFKSFIRLLHSFGYLSHDLYPHTFRKGAVVFDIHTHLLWADRIKARQHLLAVAQEKLFREAEHYQIADQPARRLNPYDQVLYLGLHALKHNLERLIWLVDIQKIVGKLAPTDWPKLIERAHVLGLSRTLAQILYLLQDLLQLQIPASAADFLQKQGLSAVEKWVLRRRKLSGRLPGWSTLVLFPAGMQRGRWQLVWETFFPRPEIIRQGFPDASGCSLGWLYARRFFHLLKYAVGKAPLASATGHS